MKNSLKTVLISILICLFFHNAFFNSLSLLMDPENYIPNKSSIFTFKPYYIDSGSGGYWVYGEDLTNYYYFDLDEGNTYFYIKKSINCPKLDKLDFKTWCNPIKVKQK